MVKGLSDLVHQNLEVIAFSDAIEANDDGTFSQVSWKTTIREFFRGLLGAVKRTSPSLIEYRFLQLVNYAAAQNLLDPVRIKLIHLAAAKVLYRKNDHTELTSLINQISQPAFRQKDSNYAEEYYFHHKIELEPRWFFKKSIIVKGVFWEQIPVPIQLVSESIASDNVRGKSEPLFKLLASRSEEFDKRSPFPTVNNRILTMVNSAPITQQEQIKLEVVEHANSTRPIMHVKVKELIQKFLIYKREHGSSIEKSLYQNMQEDEFIDRLLTKRPLMFMTGNDIFLLRNGQEGSGGFEEIGTESEKEDLILRDYLSYDEMAVAAFLGVSVPTHFINDGGRFNQGKRGEAGSHEAKGVYTGLVGARFEKTGVMEYAHMLITPEQNTIENQYGPLCSAKLKLWADFYGQDYFPTYEEAVKDTSGKYIKLGEGCYLNKEVYKKRLRLVIEPFLLDANERGMDQKKSAYVHAVGLGIGVWAKDPELQADLMLAVYEEMIHDNKFPHISDIDFSWFPDNVQNNKEWKDKDGHQIAVHFSKRNPAEKLHDEQKFVAAMYAWDGNSFPGNEYWAGALTASGDPAAACCSNIAELQNPEINLNVSSKQLKIF